MIVELADGTELEFPDGTTPQQAQAAARKYLTTAQKPSGAPKAAPVAPGAAPAAQAPVEGAGGAAFGVFPKSGKGRKYDSDPLGKMGKGVANAGIEAYLGGKQLFTDLDSVEMDVLRQSREDVKAAGGYGGLGQVAGNVGILAAGSAAAPARLAKALTAARGAAPVTTAAAVSGVQSGALTPVEDQENKYAEKGKEALKSAATAGALVGGGRLLKKAATRPFTPSADAENLMEQGVYPTLQQGAESRVGQLIGGLASGSKAVPRRQAQEVLDALTERAAGGKASLPGGTLQERLGVVDDVITKDYEAATRGRMFPMTKAIREDTIKAARSAEQPGGRFKLEADEAERLVQNVIGDSTTATRMGFGKLAKDYLQALEEAAGTTSKERVRDAVSKARDVIVQRSRNSRLTTDELAALQKIDDRYFDLMRLKEASKGAGGHETGVSIRKLAEAYGRAPGMDKMGATNATDQQLIGPAYRMLANTESENAARGTLLNWRRAAGLGTLGAGAAATGMAAPTAAVLAPLYATSIAGQTKAGSRYLFGDYDWQKKLRGALDSEATDQLTIANLLRKMRDSNSLGFALTPGE